MKNFLTAILLIFIFCLFAVFISVNNTTKQVLQILSPTKFIIDLDNDKIADPDETICLADIESFSTAPEDEFTNKYTKNLNISKEDIISLGYLAEDFTQKTLENRNVSIKFTNKKNAACRYAHILINDLDYGKILAENGFGIFNGEIKNSEKYSKNLKNARKLNLVILNHHSNKYHTLTCPYGNAAHDKIIIPKLQLPKGAKPCKFCHKTKIKRKINNTTNIEKYNIPNIPQPPLKVTSGNIRSFYTDFTTKFKPDSNCTETVCREFVKLVNSSQISIDMALYGYDNIPAITEALQKAKARGIKIRYVYDESFYNNSYYKNNEIISNLAAISKSDRTESKTQSNMLMHNKFIIFDNSIVYTGSMNFSKSGLSGYDVNNIIIIKSDEIARLYTKEFEQMLCGKFHKQKSQLNLPNRFTLDASEIEIYFSPKDSSAIRIIELVKNAKKYIYIPAFLITHKEISNELINAKNRGVDVRVIIDANSTNTRNTKHAQLRSNGILLKTENYAGKLHSKSMIIDDEYVITGSMNFSNSGENKNDENLLIIKDKKIAVSYRNFFLYLWTKIPNKYLKYNAKPESKDSIGSCSDGVDNNFNGKIDNAEALCR